MGGQVADGRMGRGVFVLEAELGKVGGDGLVPIELLLRNQQSQRRRGEGFGRRAENEPGSGRHRKAAGHVAIAEAFEKHDPAVLDDPHGRARDMPLLQGRLDERPDRGRRFGGKSGRRRGRRFSPGKYADAENTKRDGETARSLSKHCQPPLESDVSARHFTVFSG